MRQSKVKCRCCGTEQPVRICSECGQPKALDDFISQRRLDGGRPYAKTCCVCRSKQMKRKRRIREEAKEMENDLVTW